jgi:hypothetical protein
MNFYTENYRNNEKWSIILDRSTHEDSSKFNFVFFFEFCAIFYEFWKLELISEAFKGIKDVEN